ncbi:Csm5 family CRISPR-associated RAMP protein (fragment) [Hyella patelloides LEGE 07179]|uniref:CRISPR system Cms protein Csm5 n=1 Tax=Hyella patelloides LEGE 07179 TaxID=945734 RepID=A0A563W3N0_9CYAN
MLTSNIVLEKDKAFEIKVIELTCPNSLIHIGSEVSKLNPFEYVKDNDRVYYPNQSALIKSLHQRGRLKDYIHKIETGEEIALLLQDTFGDWKNLRSVDNELIFPRNKRIKRWTNKEIKDIRPMIRNGRGELYIPGSSIKGAIRTAIAYHIINHEDTYQVLETKRISAIEKTLREKLNTEENKLKFKKKQKFADDKLFMESIFSDFQLIYKGHTAFGKTDISNTDFMRAIQITDTKSIIKQKNHNLSVVPEVIICSHDRDNRAK